MAVYTRHPAEIAREQEQKEIRMYGVTIAGMREAVEESITFRFAGAGMMVASMLSDAQEMMQFSDNDFMIKEDIRQLLNRAKWILSTYVMEQK